MERFNKMNDTFFVIFLFFMFFIFPEWLFWFIFMKKGKFHKSGIVEGGRSSLPLYGRPEFDEDCSAPVGEYPLKYNDSRVQH